MLPKKLKNFTCFVDGTGYAGIVSELEPPKLTIKSEEYRGGGMDAPVEVDMGMEKLESTLTFVEYAPELFDRLGLVDGETVGLTLRGAAKGRGEEQEIIINLTGGFRELDPGTWKAGDEATLKASVAASYYKLTIDGTERVEIDVENMVRRINGTDKLEGMRKALGL